MRLLDQVLTGLAVAFLHPNARQCHVSPGADVSRGGAPIRRLPSANRLATAQLLASADMTRAHAYTWVSPPRHEVTKNNSARASRPSNAQSRADTRQAQSRCLRALVLSATR